MQKELIISRFFLNIVVNVDEIMSKEISEKVVNKFNVKNICLVDVFNGI